MKKLLLFIVTMHILISCDQPSNTGSIEEAEVEFIKEVQYMTEKEALSKEIDYYKAPYIHVKNKVRDLTGKDAIHECNLIIEKNEKAMQNLASGAVPFCITINVEQEKEFAVNHPDDIVGAEYYFEGTFTHWNKGYNVCKAKVLCINGRWIVLQQFG